LKITLTQTGVGGAIDLSFPSLAVADVSHVGNVYTVVANKVGTSVFQPGSNADAPKQVAMGLVGVLIVTPSGCAGPNMMCAYDGNVSYTDEALVATTDLDLAFATNPAAFDMGYFGQSPTADGSARQVYHVVNGQSFPDTQVIDVRANDSLLLRSVNAGVSDKSMSLLGLRQTLLARNASAYQDPQSFISPLVGPGETADLVVNVPADAAPNQRYALIDAGRQMNHGTDSGFGGALTFLNVWPSAPPPLIETAPPDPTTGGGTPGGPGPATDPAAEGTQSGAPVAPTGAAPDPGTEGAQPPSDSPPQSPTPPGPAGAPGEGGQI
jgi:FtsP/CotA-like multicopper oxidase with cupredoxin domain